jgi:ribose transport system substrate-binding protein
MSSSDVSTTDNTVAGERETVAVDVGTQAIQLPTGTLRIVILMNAQSNEWQSAFLGAAVAEGEAHGHSVTVLNADFDAQRQLEQIREVAAQREFDAAVITPIDGELEGGAISQELPQANVLVSVAADMICGRHLNSGDDLWQPGTLNFVGGDNSVSYVQAFLGAAARVNPGPQRVALIAGIEQHPATTLALEAVERFRPEQPAFRIEDVVFTDYTTATGCTRTAEYLRAHPDTTMLLSVYSPDLSRGVVHALQELGRLDEIAVADMGGSVYTCEQIAAGTIQLTLPFFPKENARLAVRSILEAQAGRGPRRFITDIPSHYGTMDAPLVVTRDNLDAFTPEF